MSETLQTADVLVMVTLALAGLLLALLTGKLMALVRQAEAYLDAKLTDTQMALLHRIAAEGVALAGQLYKDLDGTARLNKALAYVIDRLPPWMPVTDDMLRAAIEKEYAEMKAKWAAAHVETVNFIGPDPAKIVPFEPRSGD